MFRNQFSVGLMVCVLLTSTGGKAGASALDSCKDIANNSNDAATIGATVLECLEALASNAPREETKEQIQFVRPSQYGPNWSTYPGYRNFEYAMDSEGMVRFRGMMSGCPSRTEAIFVLPEGYRPTVRLILSAMGGTGNDRGRVDVTRDGNVYFWWSANKNPCPAPEGASRQWLSIEGLTFEGEQ